jgi:hypothetical protein
MAILKFRVYYEEDESVYRDILIRHTHTFFDLHNTILHAWDFDSKHQATFFRSNDKWLKGREISLEKYDKAYPVAPLIMKETTIASEIKDTNQRFIYHYDFIKLWSFLVELIGINKEENPRIVYPSVSRKEGIGPQQYGTRGLLGPKFAEMEEKYDLVADAEGFTEEGEEGAEGESDEGFAADLGIGGADDE